MRGQGEIRSSELAGTWYPQEPERLRAMVDELLAGAVPGEAGREPRAMIVPHAGYAYSGRGAACGWARVAKGRWRRAVLVAPSHYHSFSGGAVFPGRGFRSPLGVVETDPDGRETLGARSGFVLEGAPYAREHSLEIQLPFLQRVDPGLKVVPVLVGAGGRELAWLGAGLRALDDGNTLFVVSSDFTHYGESFDYLPFPAASPETVADRLRELDFGAIAPILRLDAEGFAAYVHRTGVTICGRAPIEAFLRGGWQGLAASVASYYTSLDVTGDFEHSVSYATILFTASIPS